MQLAKDFSTLIRAFMIVFMVSAIFGVADTYSSEPPTGSARERALAVRSMSEQGGEESVAFLVAALKDENMFVRGAAMQTLQSIGRGELAETVVLALTEALDDEEPRARAGAAETLGMLKAKGVAASLAPLLEDDAPQVQHAAACALARMEAKESIPVLIALVRDDNAAPFARMGAAWALGELAAREAVAPLLEVMESGRRGEWNYTSVAVYAAEALGKINDPASVPRLVEALSIEDRHLRAQLAICLECMTGQKFGQDQEKWKTFLGSNP